MTKHTPGPWRSMKDGSIIPLKSVYCERLGFQVGFVNTDNKLVEIEAQANAYLIAAAPDLLEAAQLCRQYMYEHASNTQDNAFDKLCAAIAKATGEQ